MMIDHAAPVLLLRAGRSGTQAFNEYVHVTGQLV